MKRTLVDTETATYASFGRAALIPGMQYTLERMQEILDDMRAGLSRLQNGGAKPRGRVMSAAGAAAISAAQKARWARIRTGKSPKVAGRAEASSGYWAKMTPEERSAEMARRMKVGQRNARKKRAPVSVAALRRKQQTNGEAIQ